ncbi:MAG TPA: glycosyltransferase, TIGR04372 family protein [Acidimicrobium sp.]|nr:glycosyltransferase, TIGR04372 family protein [Acidimicrobium sp.]
MQTNVKRLARLAIAVPIALIFILLIRVIRPLVVVRIGVMRSDRIGHFVLETELQQLEIEHGIAKQPVRSFNIWYAPEPISNRVIYEMWKRVMRIWPNWFMVPVFRLNNLMPGSRAHQIPNTASTCLDVHNLIDDAPPHLSFTPSEIEIGNRTLKQMGLGEGDRFVCFIVRDAAYTKMAFPDKDMSYHDYRNCDVDDYVLAAEAVADRGLFVFRMGSVVAKPLRSTHQRVIDYANSRFRSEFMDVFLGANCEFCVSDGLGYYAIPAAFRRPNAYVNYSPFHMFYSSRACDLGIAKTVSSLKTGKRLNLSQMGENGIAQFSHTAQYLDAGVSIDSNTPEEIRDLMIEMLDRIEGSWMSQSGDDELQKSFWRKYSEVIGEQRTICHGEIRAKYGAQFLRDNRDWIL